MTNILDQMREVEEAAEWRDPAGYFGSEFKTHDTYEPFSEDERHYIALTANHAPDIVKFARRLMEVVRVSKRAIDRYKGSVLISERELGALDLLARLERDYPGVLGDGGGE